MPNQQQQIDQLKRQRRFAWAKYYEEMRNSHVSNINTYELNTQIEGVENLPTHLVDEIQEMNKELKRSIECPICMEIIIIGSLSITGCGHKYCTTCLSQLDKCAICKRKIKKTSN